MLSTQIKQAREQRGWSQEELAERVGVDSSTIRRWESGERKPYAYHWVKLQAVLGITSEQRMERKKRMDNEQSGTYFVSPSDSEEENRRLDVQSRVVRDAQGGTLPEQAAPERFRRVLDIGCGTGNWLIDLARDYPEMTELVGVDISGKRIAFAREQAQRSGVKNRVRFQVLDALLGLPESEFPGNSFDLIDVRFAMSWLRILPPNNAWLKLLGEIWRVLKPGGTIRLVETLTESANMPAFNHFWDLGIRGGRQSGHITETIESVAELFPQLLDAAGFRSIQHREISTVYHRGTPAFPALVEDKRLLVQVSGPHLEKWLHVTDYSKLAGIISRELDSPDFELTWTLVTAWATK